MIKLFADGADYNGIVAASKNPLISGFTTNPTLMRQAGVTDYEQFARQTIEYLSNNRPDTCLSLEVFADDFDGMSRQARIIDSWGVEYDYKVYVKIPVMNTKGVTSYQLVEQLSKEGIRTNVTAVFTEEQIDNLLDVIHYETPTIISIFAGRIADTGIDPVPIVKHGINSTFVMDTDIEFLWASPREALNYKQAEECGCHIITMTPDLIKKVSAFGKDLTQFSRETVEMFYNDAVKSGYTI